jgi:hypothetical protein
MVAPTFAWPYLMVDVSIDAQANKGACVPVLSSGQENILDQF